MTQIPAPKVEASVIMAAFNAAAHIQEQLLALARQETDVVWELIIADNGCTDETLAIVERIAPQIAAPVRIIDASARPGAAAARNAGAAAATGELLLFADADDVADHRWVQSMVEALRKHPLVGGRLELIELNGEEVASWRLPLGADDLPQIGGRPCVGSCNCGVTSHAFAEVGGFDERFDGAAGEDWDLALKLNSLGVTAVFAGQAIMHYRYRREPWQAVRQNWDYGRGTGLLYGRHAVKPPTILDLSASVYRNLKQAVRSALRGRIPVFQAVDTAYVVAEASVIWRLPSFWQPVYRRMPAQNPLIVQRDRLIGLLCRKPL